MIDYSGYSGSSICTSIDPNGCVSPSINSYVSSPGIVGSNFVFNRSNGECFSTDEIVTMENLTENLSLLYELIYKYYCKHEPEKESEYKTLLKMNDFDFKTTVIQIELNRKQNK